MPSWGARPLGLLVLALAACGPVATPEVTVTPGAAAVPPLRTEPAAPRLVGATLELHAEPRFWLEVAPEDPALEIEAVRVTESATGQIVTQGTTASGAPPCASGPLVVRSARLRFPDGQRLAALSQHPTAFRIEVLVGGTWRSAQLRIACRAIE